MAKPNSERHPAFGHAYLIRADKCRMLERLLGKPINELIDDWIACARRIEIESIRAGDPERRARAAAKAAKRAARTPEQIAALDRARDKRGMARWEAKQRQG